MNSLSQSVKPAKRQPRTIRPVCHIIFKARTYDPLPLLNILDLTPIADVQMKLAAGASLPGFCGETTGDLAGYMLDHDLVVFGKPAYKSARIAGRWAARYTLILGRRVQ